MKECFQGYSLFFSMVIVIRAKDFLVRNRKNLLKMSFKLCYIERQKSFKNPTKKYIHIGILGEYCNLNCNKCLSLFMSGLTFSGLSGNGCKKNFENTVDRANGFSSSNRFSFYQENTIFAADLDMNKLFSLTNIFCNRSLRV